MIRLSLIGKFHWPSSTYYKCPLPNLRPPCYCTNQGEHIWVGETCCPAFRTERRKRALWGSVRNVSANSLFSSMSCLLTASGFHRCPNHFEKDSLNKETTGNWALAAGNLRKLLRMLDSYFTTVLHKRIDTSSVDVNAIGMCINRPQYDLFFVSSSHCLNHSHYAFFGWNLLEFLLSTQRSPMIRKKFWTCWSWWWEWRSCVKIRMSLFLRSSSSTTTLRWVACLLCLLVCFYYQQFTSEMHLLLTFF